MSYQSIDYIKDLSRSFRKEPTNSEKILWQLLRRKNFKDLKFKRQYPVGRYILDFYCSKYKLVIEIDGKIHQDKEQKEYDKLRQEELENSGFIFFRVSAEEVEQNPKDVLIKLKNFIEITLS